MKLYASSVVDPERQVRELAQECLFEVVRKDKKWLSSVAKKLFFPWMGSLYDPVGFVASVSQRAFTTCFGKDREAQVCNIAAKSILLESSKVLLNSNSAPLNEEEKLARTFEMCHGLNALAYLISNSSEELLHSTIRESSVLLNIKSVCKFFENQNSDSHAALYRLMAVSLQKKLIKSENVIVNLDMILRDLQTSVATQSIDVLKELTLGMHEYKLLCNALETFLGSDVPKGAIMNLVNLLDNIHPPLNYIDLMSVIWKVLNSYKSLDTSRYLVLWNLFSHGLYRFENVRELLEASILSTFHPSPQTKAVRPEILNLLYPVDPEAFMKQFLTFMKSSNEDAEAKIELAIELPTQCDVTLIESVLVEPFLSLPEEKKIKVVSRILARSYMSPATSCVIQVYCSEALMKEKSRALELADRLSNLSLEKRPNALYATELLISRLQSLSTSNRLTIAGLLLERNVDLQIVIDKDTAIEACNAPISTASLLVILKAMEGTIGKLAIQKVRDALPQLDLLQRVERLLPVTIAGFEQGNQQLLAASFVYFMIELGFSPSKELGDDHLQAITHIPRLDRDLQLNILPKILDVAPQLWNVALNVELERDPELLKGITGHLNRSVALCSVPMLLIDENLRLEAWNDTDTLAILRIIMLAALQIEPVEIFSTALVILALSQCCAIESQYLESGQLQKDNTDDRRLLERISEILEDSPRVEPLFATVDGPMGSMVSLLKEFGGFYYVVAQKLGIKMSFEELLLPDCPLGAAFLADPRASFELPDDFEGIAILKLMLTIAAGYEWKRDQVFQLMARTSIDFDDRQALLITTRFICNVASRKDLNIKAEYWEHHLDMLNKLFDRSFLIFDHPDQLTRNLLLAEQTFLICTKLLDSETLRGTVVDRAAIIWEAFASIVEIKTTPANTRLLHASSGLIVKLGPALRDICTLEEVCTLCFKSHFPEVKLACRSLLVPSIDVCLERARIRLSQERRGTVKEEESFETLRESLLIPWEATKAILLERGNNSVLLNEYLAFDLFLCLAEGSVRNSLSPSLIILM